MINKLRRIPLLLPLSVAVSYLLLIIDIVKYPGFVGKHFIIDAKVYSALALTIVVIYKKDISGWIKKTNLLVLILSSSAYVLFSYLETLNYVNYILNAYKISLEGLIYIPLFSTLLIIANERKVNKLINLKSGFWQIILSFFVIYALFVNFGKALNQAVYSNLYIVTHLTDTRNEKMYYEWGEFYDYMVFVQNNTPDDATIIIPPHIAPWWNRSGDMNLVKSFLYPRKLIQYGTEEIPNLEFEPKGAYILVTWGEWGCDIEGMCRRWPTQEIKASEFIIKKASSTDIKETKGNIIFDPADTQYPYGLIKL